MLRNLFSLPRRLVSTREEIAAVDVPRASVQSEKNKLQNKYISNDDR